MVKLFPSMYGGHPQDTYKGRVKDVFGNSLPQLEKGLILDLGASSGLTTQEISEIYPGASVIGIDVLPYLISEFRKQPPKLKFVVADAYNTPFREKAFDIVFSINNVYFVASGFSNDEAVKTFGEIMRTIKPSGHLLVGGLNITRNNLSSADSLEYDYAIFRNEGGILIDRQKIRVR